MKIRSLFVRNTLLFNLLLTTSYGAFAAPLDDVSIQQQGDVALARIKLTTPVNFLRFVPTKKTRVVEIYYERVPSSDASEPWVDREVRNVAATANTPAFTVTTRDQDMQPKLVVEFAREVEVTVVPGNDSRSFVMNIKTETVSNAPLAALPVVAPLEKTADPASVEAENNKQGQALMAAGRDALAAKNYSLAIETFNKLLMLPPNQYSQDAQEWVGVSRERAGQPAKAKVEYDLYLKLYTTGPGVQSVKQRLAKLGTVSTSVSMETATARKTETRSSLQGSISSRYYWGTSLINSTYQFNGTTQNDTYSLNDQSALITSVDATGRYINETYDNRVVFRDISNQNFIANQPSRNRINAAYLEVKNRNEDYSGRIGRQTSNGGGVMGRFDGLSAGYGVSSGLRVNANVGQLVDFTNLVQPIFYGVSVDSGPFSVYAINQTVEGILDRRAAGAEFRYFEGRTTAFAMVDYDIYFNMLNAAMLTGSYGFETGTTINAMADYRKGPMISTRNALAGARVISVADLQTAVGDTVLKQLAIDRTGSSAYSQLGITQKLSQNWQMGADVRLFQTGAVAPSGKPLIVTSTTNNGVDANGNQIPPTLTYGYADDGGYNYGYAASGLGKTISAQLIGSNLYSAADMTSIGASLISSDYVQSAQSIYIYNRTNFDRDLALDLSWNFYNQTDNLGGKMMRNMPMARIAYQADQNLSLDADLGIDVTTADSATQSVTTTRIFPSFGFRWNF